MDCRPLNRPCLVGGVLALLLISSRALAMQSPSVPPNRPVTMASADGASLLFDNAAQQGDRIRVLTTFPAPLSPIDIARLGGRGVRVLSYLNGTTYWTSVATTGRTPEGFVATMRDFPAGSPTNPHRVVVEPAR